MSSKSRRRKKRSGRNMSYTSTMVPFLSKKENVLFASKYTSSDPVLQRLMTLSTLSANSIHRKNGREDGAIKQSSGAIRATKTKTLAYGAKTRSAKSSAKLLSTAVQRNSQITVGQVEERYGNNYALLDFDSPRTPGLRKCWSILSMCDLRACFICDVRSRRGWHRIIKLPSKLSPSELVALQSCLGSDPRREALNLLRVLQIGKEPLSPLSSSRWNLLFSRKIKR